MSFLTWLYPTVRFLPSWFPGAGFQMIAMKYRRHAMEMAEKPYAFVQQQMVRIYRRDEPVSE